MKETAYTSIKYRETMKYTSKGNAKKILVKKDNIYLRLFKERNFIDWMNSTSLRDLRF
jgi:hypothetical protein